MYRGICSNKPENRVQRRLEPDFQALADSYTEICRKVNEKRVFYGLRDFYRCVIDYSVLNRICLTLLIFAPVVWSRCCIGCVKSQEWNQMHLSWGMQLQGILEEPHKWMYWEYSSVTLGRSQNQQKKIRYYTESTYDAECQYNYLQCCRRTPISIQTVHHWDCSRLLWQVKKDGAFTN